MLRTVRLRPGHVLIASFCFQQIGASHMAHNLSEWGPAFEFVGRYLSWKMFMERRQFGRRPTTSVGWLKIPGRPKLACRILNSSPKGALLELAVPSWLPFQFELMIESDQSVHTCEIRHVRPDKIGVYFLDFGPGQSRLQSKTEYDDWLGSHSFKRTES